MHSVKKKYHSPAALVLILGCLLGLISTSIVGSPAHAASSASTPSAAPCSVLQAAELADNYWMAQHPAAQMSNNWQDATFQQGNKAHG